jgi:hypothetical protein
VALRPFRGPGVLVLETPFGTLRSTGSGPARFELGAEPTLRVVVDCASAAQSLRLTGASTPPTAIVNGELVSAERVAEDVFQIPLPGNGEPSPASTTLAVRARWKPFPRSPRPGNLEVIVTNTGRAPARELIATLRFSGFARQVSPLTRRRPRLAPGASVRLSWPIVGDPDVLPATVTAIVTATNARAAEATTARSGPPSDARAPAAP